MNDTKKLDIYLKDGKTINFNITSKFKKDLTNEIKSKIEAYWDIDYLVVKQLAPTYWLIEHAPVGEWTTTRLTIFIDIKEKFKVWNLLKDYGLMRELKDYPKKEVK